MKNKKIFIDGLSSFLIIGGFLSPSYSVFAMKRSTKLKISPKMKRSTKKTSKMPTKDKKTEFDSNMVPSKKKNGINSKQDFFLNLMEVNDSTLNSYSKFFKDQNFGELVLNKDDVKALGEKFQIMERFDDFCNDPKVFLTNVIISEITPIQMYNLLLAFLINFSAHHKHILLFPSNLKELIPVPQEISIELFLFNLVSVYESLCNNIVSEQLIRTKLLFFIYATGLYFFFQINTIKKEDLLPSQLTKFLYIPIFINKIKENCKDILNTDKLFNTDVLWVEKWIHDFCNKVVILNRLDKNEQMLFNKISQHLKDGYTNFLTQYKLNTSSLFSETLKQLLSSENSQELLRQFLCDITYPLISLLRHFRNSGFVFFTGKDTDGKYVCISLKDVPNRTKDLQLFEKRATFLIEALSPNCVKDDKSITKTIEAMKDILHCIPIIFSIIESEEQLKKIYRNQNFSWYQFSENAGISTEYQNLTQGIKGCLDEKINDKINQVLETITEEELKKINSIIKGGYINLDGHLSRSFCDLKWNVNTLNKDLFYYFFSFPNINAFDEYLDDVLKSFFKLKKDVDIIESVVKILTQIKNLQSEYQNIPSDRKDFFYDIHSNILSINKNLEECLNQLQDQDFLIDTEWINNIMDQQKKLDETIQDFKAKKIKYVFDGFIKLKNIVGSLRMPNTNDLGNINGKLDNIFERITNLECRLFQGSLSEEELIKEVSSLQKELDGILKEKFDGIDKTFDEIDQSHDQLLKAQNEVVKYNKNQIFFVNGHVKKEAEDYISSNGRYKTCWNNFIKSLSDGSINSQPFRTNISYFQKFFKKYQNTINKCIKDYDIQYVSSKDQNGQNSSVRILYGINKEKGIVIIFYVGAPFHEGSKASLSIRNFIDFEEKPLE